MAWPNRPSALVPDREVRSPHAEQVHMNRRFSRRVAALAWVLSCLLTTAGALPGLFVCVSADGQIQVKVNCDCLLDSSWESISGGASHHLADLEGTPSDDSCGPCSDIPISISTDVPIIPAQDTAFQPKELVLAAFSFSLPPTQETASGSFLPRPQPALDSTRASLRTVVLLC